MLQHSISGASGYWVNVQLILMRLMSQIAINEVNEAGPCEHCQAWDQYNLKWKNVVLAALNPAWYNSIDI